MDGRDIKEVYMNHLIKKITVDDQNINLINPIIVDTSNYSNASVSAMISLAKECNRQALEIKKLRKKNWTNKRKTMQSKRRWSH